MTPRIAQRRAAKAVRRKRRTAVKKQPLVHGTPLGERCRRWARAPIHACVIVEGLFDHGLGVVVLAREAGTGEVAMAAYLLDVYCRGVRDVVFKCVSVPEFEYLLRKMTAAPLQPVDPAYARKLLREAARYAEPLGFTPPRGFAAVEALFGDVNADACDTVFRFGHDGKPCYIASPNESPTKIRNTLQRLRNRLGDGGFTYIVPADELDLIDDDDFWEEIVSVELSTDEEFEEIPF
jgi:hypothetical protein